jgi:hypothetical protein
MALLISVCLSRANSYTAIASVSVKLLHAIDIYPLVSAAKRPDIYIGAGPSRLPPGGGVQGARGGERQMRVPWNM